MPADVAQVLLVAHGLFADAERLAEQALVQNAHIQFAVSGAVFQQEEPVADGRADDGAVARFRPGTLAVRSSESISSTWKSLRGTIEEAAGIDAAHQPVRGQNLAGRANAY